MITGIEFTFMNLEFYFSHYITKAVALNNQYRNAGLSNMSSNISVVCGAYTVSFLVLRLYLWIEARARKVLDTQ